MRLRPTLVFLAACGRAHFDAVPDAPPEIANKVFATTSLFGGNFGGLVGGDGICAAEAAAAGLPGTFVVWLSDSTTSAFARLAGSRGWVLVDGTPVADEPSDLATKSILAPIDLDARGNDVRTVYPVWSATQFDGTADPMHDCLDWTSASAADTAGYGYDSSGDFDWGAYGGGTCDTLARLYCFEVGHVAHVAFPPPAGRLAFVSSELWQPNPGGIASADALCAHDAELAHLSGTFLAVLGTASASAASRFDVTGAPWYSTNGALVADTADALFAGPLRRNFIDRTADGSVASLPLAWGGDPNLAADACAGWTSQTGSARQAISWHTDPSMFVDAIIPCAGPGKRLICLQQ